MPLLGLVLLSPSSLGQNGVSYHVLLSPTVLLLSYTIHRVYGGCTREATLRGLVIFTKHPVSDFQPVPWSPPLPQGCPLRTCSAVSASALLSTEV